MTGVKGEVMTTIRAWAVVTPRRRLVSWGSGRQSQYPIFSSRKEAKEWAAEHPDERLLVIAVIISHRNQEDAELERRSSTKGR